MPKTWLIETWFKSARPLPVLAGAMLAVSLVACSSFDSSDAPLGATVTGGGIETKTQRDDIIAKKQALDPSDASFAGALVADEPTAALIARNVLEKGGTAADAATALYFAMSVTYPAAAGLGGGGVCLARDAKKPAVESIAFLPRRPSAGGSLAIPGNVRGFALLHARYGSKSWSELISPAERLAASGFPVSRALGRQLADAGVMIVESPDLRRLYTVDGVRALRELDTLTQVELASTLARIRSSGVGGFYTGASASRLVEQAQAKGGSLTASELASYHPKIEPAQTLASGDVLVTLAQRGVGAGAFSGALWSNIQGASDAAALTAAAARTATTLGAPGGAALEGDFGSTSFAIVDGKGGAVACAVTMNGSFGAGRSAEGTGVVFATSPQDPVKGLGSAFLVPVMIVNPNTEVLYFAGAGAGAPKGGAAIEHAAQMALADGDTALPALAAGPADARSPANAIVCPRGLTAGLCSLGVTAKGNGVGLGAVASGS